MTCTGRSRLLVASLVLAVTAATASCSSGDDTTGAATATTPDATTTTTVAETGYARLDRWSCHPQLESSACTREYDVTPITTAGARRAFTVDADDDAPLDCFYVHPTIGEDSGSHGDLDLGEEEARVVWAQAAPLASTCRVFAPIFREAIFAGDTATREDQLLELDVPYADVADAFAVYLDTWNDGRPFVVVGHSQGAQLLLLLLERVIEADPQLRSSLAGAYLIGLGIEVDATGVPVAVPTLPLCSRPGERHCLVAFSSYDAASPPTDDAVFGHPWGGDGQVACVNPAAVAGGTGELVPYVATDRAERFDERARRVDTAFVTYPGTMTATCVDRDGLTYLEVTSDADPDVEGTDPIPVDDDPAWGLHGIEMALVAGNLRSLIESQAARR